MDKFLDYLRSIHPLPEGCAEYLQIIVKRKEYARKEFLLRSGQVCRNVYFVEEGLLRCYYLKDGMEVSSWFMKEGGICMSVESFLRQECSQENIQALENTVVYFIHHKELEEVCRGFPAFETIARSLLKEFYIRSEQRSFSIRMQKTHERYDWIREKFPDLLQRVPAKYIASYLGMTEVMLSLIRRRK